MPMLMLMLMLVLVRLLVLVLLIVLVLKLLLLLVMVLTQPARTVEQSVVDGAQVGVHTEFAQRVPLGQTLPQPPQWLLSVSGLMQA